MEDEADLQTKKGCGKPESEITDPRHIDFVTMDRCVQDPDFSYE